VQAYITTIKIEKSITVVDYTNIEMRVQMPSKYFEKTVVLLVFLT